MTKGFKTDTDLVRPGAPIFAGASRDLDAALAKFTSTLAGCGGMIGADEPGQTFAASYEPARVDIDAQAEQGAQLLAGLSRGVIKVADNYDDMEDKNTNASRTR